MFVAQQISAEYLTPDLLQQLGSAIWIGLERIRNQRDQPLDLLSVTANVYDSTNTLIAGPLRLDVEPDDTQPILQQAGYLLQTGPGQAVAKADIFRVVYNLKCRTGESALIQQTFVVRALPFGEIPCPPYCPDDITCDVTVTPTSLSVPAAGGIYALDVAALNNAGYSWEVSDGWIQILSAVTNGSGQAVINVSANTACMDRSGQILVCGVTIDVSQAAAVTGCCDVRVSPGSFLYDWCAGVGFIGYFLTITVTLVNPTIPSAFTDASWLHVGMYIPVDSTHGKFEVTVDFPIACVARTGHVFICDETVTIAQPFSVVFTPKTAAIDGSEHSTVQTVISGDWNNSPGLSLTVSTLSGRGVASGAFIRHLPNCSDTRVIVDTNGENRFYQPLTAIVPPDWSCPVGETLILKVTACDGTVFTITQVPKAQIYQFLGNTVPPAIVATDPGTLGPSVSTIPVPLFDPNYPAPSSAVWSIPFSGGYAPATSWTMVTQGGNSVTFLVTDPGPYLLTGAQLAELVTKMKQGTCMTHVGSWPITITVNGFHPTGGAGHYGSALVAEVTTAP